MTILRLSTAPALAAGLLASLWIAAASEQILLDPNAKPPQPASILSAVVSDATSSRRCAARLVPNGVFVLARPCTLEERLGQVRRWRMSGDTITLEDASGAPLLRFKRAGARAFRTPDELVLTILPQGSTPLAQP